MKYISASFKSYEILKVQSISLFCYHQTHTIIFIFFYVPCTIPFTVYFYTVRPILLFLFNQSQFKAGVVNSNESSLVFVEGQQLVS